VIIRIHAAGMHVRNRSRKRNRKKNWSLQTIFRNLQTMDRNPRKKNKENNDDEWHSAI
jgi:hypothetical protein